MFRFNLILGIIFYSPLFWDMVVCENESEMEKNHTKDKIEPEHINTELKRVTRNSDYTNKPVKTSLRWIQFIMCWSQG